MQKTAVFTLVILLLSFSYKLNPHSLFHSHSVFQSLHSIPAQTLNLDSIVGDSDENDRITIEKFEISSLVTLKEYKVYLEDIKQDSGYTYYKTQLPDTNIGTKEIHAHYISTKKYEAYPVVGISWENALNYCKWKTIKENPGSIRYIYRLPKASEWIAALEYLKNQQIAHDLNHDYSDWLLVIRDESSKEFKSFHSDNKTWHYDFVYLHKMKDPPALKRKIVIGNSFLYQGERILHHNYSYYANQGYRQIGFRLVKDHRVDPASLEIADNMNIRILEYWNLNQ